MARRRRDDDDWWDDEIEAHRERQGRRYRRFGRLLLDKRNNFVGGVCAGIARYLGLERWVVRLIFVAFLLLAPGIAIPAYLIMWLVMESDEDYFRDHDPGEDETEKQRRRRERRRMKENTSRTWESDPLYKNARLSLRVATGDFDRLELRLRRMEKFVASRQFDFDREFNRMNNTS